MKPRTWKAGRADEDWKREICERDMKRTLEAMHFLTYVLCDDYPMPRTAQECADAIARYSGKQIADALLAYISSAQKSLELAA